MDAAHHVNVKNPHVMQAYAINAKSVHDAVNAGAVKNLMTPVIRIAPHAQELSVPTAINAATAKVRHAPVHRIMAPTREPIE